MRSARYIIVLLVTVALGYCTFIGHALLVSYIAGHLPLALLLSGFGLILLPGLGSALVTGFFLAGFTRLLVPRFAIIVPMLAATPWAIFHLWVWHVYGTRDIWWVVFSDIGSLMMATYIFAILLGHYPLTRPPNNSFKADGSAAA